MKEYRERTQIRDFFNRQRSAYLELTKRRIFREVENSLTELAEGTVVDLGGGPTLNFIGPKVTSIVKVDISDSMLLSKGKYEDLSFVIGDASHIPLKDAVADTVILQNVLHHLCTKGTDETIRRIRYSLSEAFRILRFEGKLIIVEPCFYRAFFWLQKKMYSFLYPIYNFAGFPPVFFHTLSSLLFEIELLSSNIKTMAMKCPTPLSCRRGWSVDVPYWLSLTRTYVISALKQGP